ncbi:MAG: transglutaminase, partial [Bacteroidota bacterium]
MEQYLKETYFFDYSNASIQSMIEAFHDLPIQEKIAGLFQKVRDGWRYNPYVIHIDKESSKASF